MRRVAALIALATLVTGGVLQAEEEPLLWVGCGITKKAFMAELAKGYQRRYGTEIVLEGGGAQKGIQMAAAKQAPMGGTCRNRIRGDLDETRARLAPVAWDALVVIVHPDNPVEDISLARVQAVYDGTIDNWAQLGGPDRPLKLAVRKGNRSGVGRTLRELVFGDPEFEFGPGERYPSSGPLEQAVESDPDALGITGVASAQKRNVKMLRLEGKAPSYDNIRSGDYLLYRPLYIAYNPGHPRSDEVRRFLDYAHSEDGRAIIRNQGVVPYLDAVQLTRKQREQWRESRQLETTAAQ